jgi:hypothetical protein
MLSKNPLELPRHLLYIKWLDDFLLFVLTVSGQIVCLFIGLKFTFL